MMRITLVTGGRDGIERFRKSAKLARHAGIGPIPASSATAKPPSPPTPPVSAIFALAGLEFRCQGISGGSSRRRSWLCLVGASSLGPRWWVLP